MFDQTFSLIDIPRLITLIFLEGILSLDNALAIALIVKQLPEEQRKKALFVGIISSFILRGAGVLSAAYLIQLTWVQLIGAIYLIYLSISHIWKHQTSLSQKKKTRSFFKTVLLIELTDFIFAIDSIFAGIAMIGITFHPPKLPPKIWIVYVGGVSGIILMRFAAKGFTALIERFPKLEIGAYLIVGWIGIKLILEVVLGTIPLWGDSLFWMGIILFLSIGFISKAPHNSKSDRHQ